MTQAIWSYELEKGKQVNPGVLLLSEPFMMDENFKRAVVLVCEHDQESGSMGLVLNRPMNLVVSEVIEDFPPFDGELYLGGPVGTDTIQFVHRLGNQLDGAIALQHNLWWGGNFSQLKNMIAEAQVAPSDIRFFLGYSGWSVGQLEEELKESSWIIAEEPREIFNEKAQDALWKSILHRMGGVYAIMAQYPENPILN